MLANLSIAGADDVVTLHRKVIGCPTESRAAGRCGCWRQAPGDYRVAAPPEINTNMSRPPSSSAGVRR
ncbi:MAG TPA: hypothetical protein VGC34_07940, partial [Steroidobacteraceae bacterium]